MALTEDEGDWFRYVKGILDYLDIECHLIDSNEIKAIHPLLVVDDVKMGFYTPTDGHTDPASATHAMAAGARMGGAEIYRHTQVMDTHLLENGEWEVVTDKGTIVCEHVVNAAGSFGIEVASMVGLENVPSINMIHHYLVTESMKKLKN